MPFLGLYTVPSSRGSSISFPSREYSSPVWLALIISYLSMTLNRQICAVLNLFNNLIQGRPASSGYPKTTVAKNPALYLKERRNVLRRLFSLLLYRIRVAFAYIFLTGLFDKGRP